MCPFEPLERELTRVIREYLSPRARSEGNDLPPAAAASGSRRPPPGRARRKSHALERAVKVGNMKPRAPRVKPSTARGANVRLHPPLDPPDPKICPEWRLRTSAADMRSSITMPQPPGSDSKRRAGNGLHDICARRHATKTTSHSHHATRMQERQRPCRKRARRRSRQSPPRRGSFRPNARALTSLPPDAQGDHACNGGNFASISGAWRSKAKSAKADQRTPTCPARS
jgi:hypothetical protein